MAQEANVLAKLISIHALRMEGDTFRYRLRGYCSISIHALRMEGDGPAGPQGEPGPISIHALRMEGDTLTSFPSRKVRISIHALRMEGDLINWRISSWIKSFLSTPSAWRATPKKYKLHLSSLFLSTPSAWRATVVVFVTLPPPTISIHALRMEGDCTGAG